MDKVIITMVDGTVMRFPAEYAKKIYRKNELVRAVVAYQKLLKTETNRGLVVFMEDEIRRAMQAIRRINREVPPCGEVVR